MMCLDRDRRRRNPRDTLNALTGLCTVFLIINGCKSTSAAIRQLRPMVLINLFVTFFQFNTGENNVQWSASICAFRELADYHAAHDEIFGIPEHG